MLAVLVIESGNAGTGNLNVTDPPVPNEISLVFYFRATACKQKKKKISIRLKIWKSQFVQKKNETRRVLQVHYELTGTKRNLNTRRKRVWLNRVRSFGKRVEIKLPFRKSGMRLLVFDRLVHSANARILFVWPKELDVRSLKNTIIVIEHFIFIFHAIYLPCKRSLFLQNDNLDKMVTGFIITLRCLYSIGWLYVPF